MGHLIKCMFHHSGTVSPPGDILIHWQLENGQHLEMKYHYEGVNNFILVAPWDILAVCCVVETADLFFNVSNSTNIFRPFL